MEPRNSLTRRQADQLYEPLHEELRQDLLDNNTDHVVVGDTATDREIVMPYTMQLPISGRAFAGTFRLLHDNGVIDLDNQYHVTLPMLGGFAFSATVVGTEIRLNIVTNGVGENPTLTYRRYAYGAV